MAENIENSEVAQLAPQVEFVGTDFRFAGVTATALAEFIALTRVTSSEDEATASVVETVVSNVEASASRDVVPTVGVAPVVSDDDCLSLGSAGGNISPIRQEEKDLLEGRSWLEEMDHENDLAAQAVEASLAAVDGGETLSPMDSSMECPWLKAAAAGSGVLAVSE